MPRFMSSAARGAAHALLTIGFVQVVAAFSFYSLDMLLAAPVDSRANAQILLAQGVGAALLGGIGAVALLVGVVLYVVTGDKKERREAPKA